MTFDSRVWAVDNVEVDGQLMRSVLKSASKRYNGVDGPDDLKVSELATPADGVRIADGSGTIVGVEASHQGTYFADNDGFHQLDITPTGGSPRSDLVIVRAEDPTASSRWTQDPSTGVVFPRVVEGVLDTQTDPPVGDSAIALARIDIPANKSVISDSMIVDVRVVQQPRTEFFQDSIQNPGPREAPGLGGVFADIPHSTTHVDVPPWATRMDISAVVRTIRFNEGTGNPPNNMFGRVRATVDGDPGPRDTRYNEEWPNGVSRAAVGHAATYDAIPHQGTSVELVVQMNVDSKSGNEFFEVDDGTTTLWQVFFRETRSFNL